MTSSSRRKMECGINGAKLRLQSHPIAAGLKAKIYLNLVPNKDVKGLSGRLWVGPVGPANGLTFEKWVVNICAVKEAI